MDVLPMSKIKKVEKYLVRDLDERHKERLKIEIQEEGLIEPITVNKEPNGDFTLIAGQHRLEACKDLNFNEIDAKIYWELDETSKLLLGYMSNEARKRPAAGNRYSALYQIFEETKKKLQDKGEVPSERDIINQTYLSSSKMKTNEIIKGIIVDRLRREQTSLVNKYDLIQNAQVPRKRIVASVEQGTYPLLTAQNVFIALSNLCRQQPIDKEEEEQGKNFREIEYHNVKEFFNRIVTDFIEPWISVGNIDSAINFCRRHPFDAFTKLVAEILVQEGLPSTSSKTAPFYHNEKIQWDNLFDRLKPLKSSQVWTYAPIAEERSVNDTLYQIRFYQQNGSYALS